MVLQWLTSPVWGICHRLLPNHSNPNFVSSMKHKIQCYLQNGKDAVIQGKWMVIYTAKIQTDKTYTVYSTFYLNDFNLLFFATKPKTIILQLLLLLFLIFFYYLFDVFWAYTIISGVLHGGFCNNQEIFNTEFSLMFIFRFYFYNHKLTSPEHLGN